MNTSTNIRSFAPLAKLGEGSFASVYKVKRLSDHKIYALKKIKMHLLPTKAKQNALNEVRFLASFHSAYIVNYYEAFFDEKLEALCIVMQYADGGDLRKMITKYKKQKRVIPQTEIWRLLTNLTYGLKTLHDNSILHRDIKCENIFISDCLYKIGDMNVSKLNKNGLVYTQTGTPYYASPEVWKDQPYDDKSDIWSLGCILYEVACLRPPFMGNTMQDIYKNVLKGTYPSIPQCYSHQLSNIIQQCLYLNPKRRPSSSALLDNPTFKLYQNMFIQQKMPQLQIKVQMLQTICLPNNIKSINSLLPKAMYQIQTNGNAASEFHRKIVCVPLQENLANNQFKIIDNFVIGETGNQVYPQLGPQANKIAQESSQNVKQKIDSTHPYTVPSPIKQIQNKIAVSNIYFAQCQQKVEARREQMIKPYIKNQLRANKRRVLKQIQANQKPRSRTKSLPRTQRKSMLASKQLTESIQKMKQKLNNSKENEGKNHRHWNIIKQAKKYLQRSAHKSKSKKLF